MILILSSPADVHATAVLDRLHAAAADAAILDLGEFPRNGRLSMRFEPQGELDWSLEWPGLGTQPLHECGAVWYRRPQPFELDPALTDAGYRAFAHGECHEAIQGLWHAHRAAWMNPPERDETAHRKPLQLRAATEVGLTVPRTCITNSPAAARRFVAAEGIERTVYKSFSATERDWRETRLLRRPELDLIDRVRHAPVIFQEFVPARYDLRITLVGSAVFAAAIDAGRSEYPLDFRMDLDRCSMQPWALPPEIERRLLALMARLGLVYGAVDMRLTPDDRYVFLEVNPAGQWLFVEDRTGLPIASALAGWLATEDRRHRRIIERRWTPRGRRPAAAAGGWRAAAR
jgi:hypothetical protein